MVDQGPDSVRGHFFLSVKDLPCLVGSGRTFRNRISRNGLDIFGPCRPMWDIDRHARPHGEIPEKERELLGLPVTLWLRL